MGMTKTRKIIQSLSGESLTAISQADGTAQGAIVHAENPAVLVELALAGLIGPKGGLTMVGSIIAAQMFDDLLDDLMGMGA